MDFRDAANKGRAAASEAERKAANCRSACGVGYAYYEVDEQSIIVGRGLLWVQCYCEESIMRMMMMMMMMMMMRVAHTCT